MRVIAVLAGGLLALWTHGASAQWESDPSSTNPSIVYRSPDWRQRTPNDPVPVFSCLLSNRIGLYFRLPYDSRPRQEDPERLTVARSDGRTIEMAGRWSLTSETLGTTWTTEVPFDHQIVPFMTQGDWVELRTPLHSERIPLAGAAPLFTVLRDRCILNIQENRARRTINREPERRQTPRQRLSTNGPERN